MASKGFHSRFLEEVGGLSEETLGLVDDLDGQARPSSRATRTPGSSSLDDDNYKPTRTSSIRRTNMNFDANNDDGDDIDVDAILDARKAYHPPPSVKPTSHSVADDDDEDSSDLLRRWAWDPEKIETSSNYDFVIDISGMNDVKTTGWKLLMSDRIKETVRTLQKKTAGVKRETRLESRREQLRKNITGKESPSPRVRAGSETETGEGSKNAGITTIDQRRIESDLSEAWVGAFVAVVGLYNRGKTHLLNSISGAKLLSGLQVHTEGLSFKMPEDKEKYHFTLLDTAGSHSPVQSASRNGIEDRKATEFLLQELVFDLSDIIIFVVGDLTWFEQESIAELTTRLEQCGDKKSFKQLFIVHNWMNVNSVKDFDEWKQRVMDLYPGGEKTGGHYNWKNTRHLFLAHDQSPAGRKYNSYTYDTLRTWCSGIIQTPARGSDWIMNLPKLLAVHMSGVVEDEVTESNIELREDPVLHSMKYVWAGHAESKEFKLRNVRFRTESGKETLLKADGFFPKTDIIESTNGTTIYVEVPGVAKNDVKLSCLKNSITISAVKHKPYEGNVKQRKMERKYGSFTWKYEHSGPIDLKQLKRSFENGVILITIPKGEDEEVELGF